MNTWREKVFISKTNIKKGNNKVIIVIKVKRCVPFVMAYLYKIKIISSLIFLSLET